MSSHHENDSTPSLNPRIDRPGFRRFLPFLALNTGALLVIVAAATPLRVFSMSSSVAQSLSPSPMQAPAGTAAAAGPALDATQVAALRGHLGEFVEVKGMPTGTGQSKSGSALYLNFSRQRGGAVTVVFFLPKGNATPSSGSGTRPSSLEDLKQFIGKSVTVKGQLTDYQGDVQMVVPYLEQIKVN